MMRRAALMMLVFLVTTAAASTQAPPKADPPKADPPKPAPQAAAPTEALSATLHLTVSKYLGDKKLSSVPFLVSVTDRNPSRIRAGAKVPVPTIAPGSGSQAAPPVQSFHYEQLGLSIDVNADPAPGGRVRVSISASDTSVVPSDQTPDVKVQAPVFRTISLSNSTLLRDGQSMQLSSATDPISGLVMRVDVTLNLTK